MPGRTERGPARSLAHDVEATPGRTGGSDRRRVSRGMPPTPRAVSPDALAPYRGKRDFAGTPEPAGGPAPPAAGRGEPLRRAAAPGPPAALRLPARDRRRAGQLGGAEGPDARPERAAARVPRRGPPARVLRLRGRHPGRRVRRRRRDRLGLRAPGSRTRPTTPTAAVDARRAARRPARREAARAASCWCAPGTRRLAARSSGCCCTSTTSTPSTGWDPEDHPRSVLSGRTNDEVKADPDRLWRSDLPAGRAAVP